MDSPPRRAPKILLVLATAALAGACGRVDRQQHADAVRRLTAQAPSWVERTEVGKRLWSVEQKFYEQRNDLPAWIDGDDPTPQLDALLQALGNADLHGLDPSRYGVSGLVAERRKADEATFGTSFDHERVPELDVRLTYAFLTHAGDLLGWTRSPRDIDRNWLGTPKKEDLLAHLTKALDGNRVRETLDALAPAHPQYKGLQAAQHEEIVDPGSIDWSDTSAVAGVRFRQAPGPDNALGLVKFIFPNHFNVYLHDTPGDALFNRERRALSHGCIRLEKPVELAEYVLSDQPQWTSERINTAMRAGQEQSVTLKKALPVHIGYWTAWVGADGQVGFVEDLYGLDRAHARLMAPAAPSATRAE